MTAPDETFVKVPTFVHAAVGTGALSPTALALYVMLRSYRNHQKQVAWPSLPTLAKAMNMKNPRNLIKYIGELEAIGAVIVTKDQGTSNVYIFPETGTSAGTTTRTSGGTTPAENHKTRTSGSTTTRTSGSTTPVPQEVLPPVPQEVPKPDRRNQIEKKERIERLADASRPPLRSAADALTFRQGPRTRNFEDVLPWLIQETGRELTALEELRVKQELLPSSMSMAQIRERFLERIAS